MATASIASLIAVLALGFVEGMRRFYPSRETWRSLRSKHGRRAVRAMRERLEAASTRETGRWAFFALAVVVILWVGFAAPAMAKRWYEVALDALPYGFIGIAFLRVPGTLRAIAERMRGYEMDVGEDPERELDDGFGSNGHGGDGGAVAL